MRKRPQKSSISQQAGRFIRKLNIRDGDVILIKKGSGYDSEKMLKALAEQFEKVFHHKRTIAIVVNDLEDIRKADEATMLKYGWLRWPRGKVEDAKR